LSTDNIRDYGTVACFRDSFGFIKPDGSGQSGDVFFHISNVKLGDPQEGTRVSYFIAPDKRHPNRLAAHDVTVLP